MKKILIVNSLFAIRWLIALLCVVCSAVPTWAGHDTHYARVTVTASPTGQGKVYMTTEVDKLPASEEWQASMSEDWNCKDNVGPSEEDNRTYYVHALAESGYHFVKWSSNSSGTDSKSEAAKYAYSTSASSTSSGSPTQNSIYAIFAANPTYTVTFLTTENGTYTYQYGSSGVVTVTAEQSVETNLNFALTATPDAGYELYGWYTESGGVKTFFDYSSYSLPSYALPGNIRIGVDYMPIGTPLFQIKGETAVYTDLNAAVTACGGATKTIVLINNGTLPAGEYTIPANVTLLIPFDAAYTCYTTTPGVTSDAYISPTAYRTLTMSPGAHLTVNGKISVSAKLSGKSFAGPCGSPSDTYGAIKMLSEGETKSTITLNNSAILYSWGYIYGEGAVEVLSGAEVHEGFAFMDFRGARNTYDITGDSHKVFPFNQYYVQNIEVPLTIHQGATEKVYSYIYAQGDLSFPITLVGSDGLFRLSGAESKLTKWYDPKGDRQHYALQGNALISKISFTITYIMSINVSSDAFVLPISNNMDIEVRSGATVNISEDVCIMPDASITVEEGATMNIASGKNVYVYDKNAYTNAGTYSTSRGGYPDAGAGRYALGDYIRRISYSPSWETTPSREIRRLQNIGSARFIINGTLNASGKIYTTEGGADICSDVDGASMNLTSEAGTATVTYQVDHQDYDAYYYSIPITSAKLHNADASYAETVGNAAGTTWTYAHGHWGWCIVWRLEDGTELKRLYHYTQPNDAWLTSNAPSTSRDPEGTCSYVFNGWNKNTNAASQEIEMVADYTKTCAEYYTVTWKSEDGTETLETDEHVGQGEATRFNSTAPTKAIDPVLSKLYTFDGWSTTPNGEKVYGIGATPAATSDATYYAHFAVTDVAAVLIANGETSYYTSVADALEAANNSDYTPTVQLWKNTTTPALTYTGKNHCTIDLNGYALTGTAQPLLTIDNGGYTVTITDRSQSKDGKLLLSMNSGSDGFVVRVVAGILLMEGGAIQGQNTGTKAIAGVYANNRQEVIMTGGKIQVEAQGTAYGIFTQGKATVNGGTIHAESATKSAFSVQAYGANGNAIINDGYFSAAGVSTVTCLDAASNASIVAHGGYYSTNTNLDTYKAATCRVYNLPSTKLPYRYTLAEKAPLVASVTIGGTTTEYTDFTTAWTAVNGASAASTLKLLDDVDASTALTYNNTNSQNCTLDLNGHTLTTNTAGVNAPFTINHSGITFTITDGTESKSGKFSMTGTFTGAFFGVLVQDGNLVLDAGTIEAKIGGTSGTVGAVTVYNSGAPSFTMNGGTIYVKTTNNRRGRGVYANKTATINNGTILIDAAGEGVGVQRDAGTVNISNGRFHISGSPASVTNQANNTFVKIYGGYYNINTNLSTACAANHHVFPNDDATYIYKVAEGYTLTWTTDGELAGEGYTPSGLTEVGTTLVAPTPIKAGYTFYGWTPAVAATMPSEDTEYTAQWAVASVTINGNTTLYTDFNTAFTAANNSATHPATITLLQNTTIASSLQYTNSNYQNCTLDLNGYTLSSAKQFALRVNKANVTFTITDGSANQDGVLLSEPTQTDQAYGVYIDKGRFVLNAGTIEAHLKATTSAGVRAVNENAYFTMNGGTLQVETTNGKTAYAIYSAGTATVTNGKIYVTGSTAYVTNQASANANVVIQGGKYNTDAQLETCVSAPYHKFSLAGESPYLYKVAEGYTVTFNNYDGTSLQSGVWEKGATPEYSAETPTKPADAQYTYTFDGWNAAIVPVTANVTYTAHYSSTVNTYTVLWKDEDGTTLETDENVSYGTTPTYDGATPTKPADASYAYTFNGWSPAVGAITGTTEYTATYTTTPVVASVTVSGSTTYYTTFGAAWSSANSATAALTLKLLSDVTVTSKLTYDNSNTQNCTLDLNGHTLTSETDVQGPLTINNANVTFTITDSGESGMLLLNTTSTSPIFGVYAEKGSLILTGGTIEARSGSATTGAVTVNANGTFTMEGGTLHVVTTNNRNGRGVYSYNNVTINDGTIHVEAAGTGYGIYLEANKKATVNGGKFNISGSTANKSCICNTATANTNLLLLGGRYNTNLMTDGTTASNINTKYVAPGKSCNYHIFDLEGESPYLYKVAEGYTVTFNNYDDTSLQSSVWEKGAIPAYSGTPTKPADAQYTYTFNGWSPAISSVTASATYTATYSSTVNNYTVTVVKNVDDYGSISSTEITSVPYGSSITVEGNTFTVNGTTVTATPETSDAQYTYTFDGWTNAPGTVEGNMTITANFTRSVNNYTVLWKDADGTTLETDEDVPYGTTPTYDGATPTKATDEEGIYTFNGWSPVVGAITDNTEYTATYSTTPVVASVTISGATTYYTTFNTAWTAANSATAASTIKLLSDITATSILTYNNSNTQDCTLDLNGHTISSTQQAVLNPSKAGITFTMTDHSENHNGKLLSNATSTSTAYGVLVSAGTFVMENGTIEAHLKATTSKGVRVSGGASFTMNGGTIEVETTNSKDGDGVYTQAENATVTIHGGEIHVHAAATGYAVNVAGTTTITGGKFSASGSSSACIHKASGTLTLQGGYYSADTNLADNCATNYHVFPNDDATYIYKVAEGYTVNFQNGGELLQSGLWEKGSTPIYSGETPTKDADAQYTYTFNGWDSEIVAVTGEATYNATYTATLNVVFEVSNPETGVTSYKDIATTSEPFSMTVKGTHSITPVVDGLSDDTHFAVTITTPGTDDGDDTNFTYTFTYTPDDFGTGSGVATHTATFRFKDETSGAVSEEVTIRGRSLPETFVIAVKNNNKWYALPSNLQNTSSQPAIVPVEITVNDPTTPTAALLAPQTALYKATTPYQNIHTTALRFTATGSNYLQVSGVEGTYNMWLSNSGGTDVQDWQLYSTNFNAYELTIPSHAYPTKKMGIYDGSYMGYHTSPSNSQIYLLPVTADYTPRDAKVKEWGRYSVVVEVETTNIATVKAHIDNAAPTAALTPQPVNVATIAGAKNLLINTVDAIDFSAQEGHSLYLDWYNASNELIASSQISVPLIIAGNTTMSSIDNVKTHWEKKEVHVLPGVKLIADADAYASENVTVKTLEVYPNATLHISAGTLNATNLHLRGGWTRANGKDYDVARVYIDPSAALTKTHAAMYYDIFDSDEGKHYYPLAVPFDVPVNTIDYADEYLAGFSTYGTHYIIKTYNGALRAEQGVVDDAWAEVASDGTLQAGRGYIITAVAVKGDAVIRIPLSFDNAWTAAGEKATVSAVTKNVVPVVAHTGTASTGESANNRRHAGWNMLGVPFMSCYTAGTDMYAADALIKGEIVIVGGSEGYAYQNTSVPYVSVPTHNFAEYIQTDITEAKLVPGWSFFVQVGTSGNLTFSVAKQREDSDTPLYAPQRNDKDQTGNRAALVLAGNGSTDKTTLIISDRYNASYEIGADLEKMFGNGNTLATYTIMEDGTRLVFNALGNKEIANSVPVGFRVPAAGEYTFSLDDSYPTEQFERIDLIDYQQGTLTNLLENSYTFTTEGTQNDSRFALNVVMRHEPMIPTATDDVTGNGSKTEKRIVDGCLIIIRNGRIYDATGKLKVTNAE